MMPRGVGLIARARGVVLLDEVMPAYDVVERHRTLVRAERAILYAALRETDLAEGRLTRILLAARALPAIVVALARSPAAAIAQWRTRRTRRGLRLADLEGAGFHVVAERAPEELVLGLLGRFWTRAAPSAPTSAPRLPRAAAGGTRACGVELQPPRAGHRRHRAPNGDARAMRAGRTARVPALLARGPPRKRAHPARNAPRHPPTGGAGTRGGGPYRGLVRGGAAYGECCRSLSASSFRCLPPGQRTLPSHRSGC